MRVPRPPADPATAFLGGALDGIDGDAFLAEHYLRRPLAVPGGARAIAEAFSWSDFDAAAAHPAADLVASREAHPAEVGGARGRAALAAGVSLAVRHAERHHAGSARIALAAAAELGGAVDVQAHAAPAGAVGFGWHFDPEEVFIVQCRGAKRWQLRENTVHRAPLLEAMPRELGFGRETAPVLACRLEPGDWLYIPSGWWHAGRAAAADDSLSLAIGVMAETPLAALDRVRAALPSEPAWRRRLPPPATAAARAVRAEALAAATEALAARLRAAALAEAAVLAAGG